MIKQKFSKKRNLIKIEVQNNVQRKRINKQTKTNEKKF